MPAPKRQTDKKGKPLKDAEGNPLPWIKRLTPAMEPAHHRTMEAGDAIRRLFEAGMFDHDLFGQILSLAAGKGE